MPDGAWAPRSGAHEILHAHPDHRAATPVPKPAAPEHPPLVCLAPHWSRWKKVVLFLASLIFAVITFLGGWALIGLRSAVQEQADRRYMPLALADGRWAKQATADEKRDAALALLAQQLVLSQVQQATQGRDLTWMVKTLDDHVRSSGERPATPAPQPLPAVLPATSSPEEIRALLAPVPSVPLPAGGVGVGTGGGSGGR